MTFQSFDDILDTAVSAVSQALGENVRVVKKYPGGKKPYPLGKTNVSIGFRESGGSAEFIGGETRCLTLTLDVGVFVPFECEASTAYDVLNGAISALTSVFGGGETRFGVLSPDKITASYELYGALDCTLYKEDDEQC